MIQVTEELSRAVLPTAFGPFEVVAFGGAEGRLHVAMVRGSVRGHSAVLARVHSECLTGDSLGSLRCDCGLQLRAALRAVAAEERGVVVYATGQEGRGIGLVEKLRAYVEQDRGADTVDANSRLGLAVDSRDFAGAAAVLAALGVRSVRLITGNPAKKVALERAGMPVEEMVALPAAAHLRSAGYLATKVARLGHLAPDPALEAPPPLTAAAPSPADAEALLGPARPVPGRPYVVLKYAQTLDGRIAASSGDSRWVSCEEERRLSHLLRSRCDAVLVGSGTARSDDPLLTVRLAEGASPRRVVLDSRLELRPSARLLQSGPDAQVLVLTTSAASSADRDALQAAGARVVTVAASEEGVDLACALAALRREGVESVLVEGGRRVITSFLRHRLADRVIASVAPSLLGSGIDAVGELGAASMREALRLQNPLVRMCGDDVVVAGDLPKG